ncbi:MAG: RIP metalloprotease RseP [Rickettsiales bacterium]
MDFLLNTFHYIWSFALVISVIVFVHEFGHFLAARLCGVKIETFSIGFGTELLGRTDRHGTRWKLALWPLGGYVKMYGDAGAASTPDGDALATMTPEQQRVSFHFKPLWAKAIIVVAGPLANFILTIAVFTYFIFTVGLSSTEPVVGSVLPDSPAAIAGLKTDDRIISIDGKEIDNFNDIPELLITNLGTPVQLAIERGTEHFNVTMTPTARAEKDALGNDGKRPMIGIRSKQITYQNVGLATAIGAATQRTYQMCATSLHLIGQMVTGHRGTEDLKGPLGIAKLSGEVTSAGETVSETLHTILWFIALLSVNLGLINLLPIPVLDGGHLAFYAIEALRGRPMAERFKEYGYRFGMVLVGCLMALSLFNDVRHIVL